VVNGRYIKFFHFVDSRKPSISDIAKHTRFNYHHVITVLKQFQKEGLIEPIFDNDEADHKSNPGNPYIVKLTLKGKANCDLLTMLQQLHDGINPEKIINKIGDKK